MSAEQKRTAGGAILPAECETADGKVERTDAREADRWFRLEEWLRAGGARFPDLYLRYYSQDHRGVHAAKDIPKDATVLYVPHSHLMTTELAKTSDIGRRIHQSGCNLRSAHTWLACYLLQERSNPKSFWKPYIDTLPQSYRNMPIYFTAEELAWLKGSFTLEKIEERIDDLKREWDNLGAYVKDFVKQHTFDDFAWSRLIVITRVFGVTIKGFNTDALVPMADMLNHRRPHTGTTWNYDDAVSGFTIVTTDPIGAHQQVYDSYGRKCNSRFFVNYGFSLAENEDNQVVLHLELPEKDPLYATKLRVLGGYKAAGRRKFQIPCDYKEKVTKEAYSFLRFCHASESEVEVLARAAAPGQGVSTKEVEPVSLGNETAVLRALAAEATRLLAGFETSLDEDNRMLADPSIRLTINQRNAVLMRRGEKEVLHYYIDLERKASELAARPWEEVAAYDKKLASASASGATSRPFDHYLHTVIVPLIRARAEAMRHGSQGSALAAVTPHL